MNLPKTVGHLRIFLGVRSSKHLGFLLLATGEDGTKPGPYRVHEIPKASGKVRRICAPCPSLKLVQRRLLDRLLAAVPVHPAAHGFVPGRSTATNAAPHVGSALLLKFDVQDFFPTVTYPRVVGLFEQLGLPRIAGLDFSVNDASGAVAQTAARLCCYAPTRKTKWALAHLPQGAPTSPAITNILCRRLDARLTGLAKKYGGTFSRFADDLSFSFKSEADCPIARFRRHVEAILTGEGFTPHPDKFRLVRKHRRQLVCGVVVNATPNVPRELRRRFRALLHHCAKDGVDTVGLGVPRFRQYLAGMASYLNGIRTDRLLVARVQQLLAAGKPHQEPPDAEGS